MGSFNAVVYLVVAAQQTSVLLNVENKNTKSKAWKTGPYYK